MNFKEYQAYFQDILQSPRPAPPYDNPDYLNYTKLNWSRMNRWLKRGILQDNLKTVIEKAGVQQWIIITEPWCGDAAHSVPFLEMMARLNRNITVEYELRDSEPFRINEYLTNGSKSIPKLIIRDTEGNDLGTWGPRPAACQVLYNKLATEKADFETVKTALQHWYNADNGKGVQEELLQLIGLQDL
ncbi:MAG: thioredoxin family protein [Chitinophagaceae bacterium]|nr:thioredoxin family protein [Chitinophagaceae bacterium]MCW5928304.1 thioredoxin family protein [Chitinophagaceae bacterium]